MQTLLLRLSIWLARLRRSPEAWYEVHSRAFSDYDAGRIDVERWWKDRVGADHGLIGHGAKSIPYAVKMLRSTNPDIREDGAGVLAAVGRDERAIDELLAALEREDEDQPRDTIIHAFGRLRNKRAIPYLAAIVRDLAADPDTRWDAADALGRIVGRRFDRQEDPIATAMSWLEAHPTESGVADRS